MSTLPFDVDDLVLDVSKGREIGARYASDYQSAKPYPHICIDDFVDPEILSRLRDDLKALPEAEDSFDNAREKLKTSYNPEHLSQYSRRVFTALNSRGFLAFLEEMTGIKGLIPDPYFVGGGIHKVANGGHLDILRTSTFTRFSSSNGG